MDLIVVDKGRKLLRKWIEFGLDYRYEKSERFRLHYDANAEAYDARQAREFDVIVEKDFCDYFLMTSDIVRHAKDVLKMGVGPGRGSAAGSLTCFSTRITEINPMLFPMMQFERFIDPSRPDMPDIDLDFAEPHKIFEYAERKYGADKIAHIGNFNRYRGKTALDDVRNAFSETMSYADVDEVKKLIVDRPDGDPRENDSIEDTLEAFEVGRKFAKKFPDAARIAMKLEGNLKGYGIHAAGMVISNRPITEMCALYSKTNSKGRDVEVIPYDKRDAERLGILKLDVLGLTTALAMQDVVEMVPSLSFEQLYDMPLDDYATLAAFARGDVTGIFQFDGRTTRGILRRVFKNWRYGDPIDFLTLADINALSRPGSLISGMTKQYERIKQGLEEPRDYGYESVNRVMEATLGCLVYQEQVMKMGSDVAGMPGDKVGALRRIIGKKKAGGAFDEFFEEFRTGAHRQSGMSDADAKELWDFMAASASYLFNIAHAISYAVIAYWAMYLKVHYPVQWYAAMLRQAKKTKDRDAPLELMQDAVQHGYLVLPPDPERSDITWSPEGEKGLRAGFMQIDRVGHDLAVRMKRWQVEEKIRRDEHPVSMNAPWSWTDMIYRKAKQYKTKPDVPQSGVEGFGITKATKLDALLASKDPFGLYHARNAVDAVRSAISAGELPLGPPNVSGKTLALNADRRITYVGLVKDIKVIDVIEADRKRTNRTAEEIRAEMKDPHLATKAKLICIDDSDVQVHVNVSRFLYPELAEDIEEIIPSKTVIHVVGKASDDFGPAIQANTVHMIDLEEEDQ